MKKLLLIFLVLGSFVGLAQETKSQLVTRFNVVRNAGTGQNTAARIANAYQELSDATIGVYPVEAIGTDTYTGSLIGLDAYTDRIVFVVFPNNNTGASTFNINTIGASNIMKDVSGTWTALSAGDILADKLYRLYNDGTRWQIDLGGSGGGGSGWGTSTDPSGTLTTTWSITGGNPVLFGIPTPLDEFAVLTTNGATIVGLSGDVQLTSGSGSVKANAGSTALDSAAFQVDPVLSYLKNISSTDSSKIEITPTAAKLIAGANSTIDLRKTTLEIAPNGVNGDNGNTFISDGQFGTWGALNLASSNAVTGILPVANMTSLNGSRTMTSADDLDQTDNLNIVYTDCAAPCNITVDLLSVGTQVNVINIGAATATLIEGAGVTLPGTTVDIAPDENAVIIYRVAATPEVYTGSGTAITPAALTKVDDTNVTLTLGGTPSTSLLQATSLTLGWTGQLSAARGGTGLSSLGTGIPLFLGTPSYTNFLSAITGTSPYYLTASGGAATASNTRTFNTANWDNHTSTYTTTANNQYASNETGTITHRATASDFTYGRTTSRTYIAAANTQRSVDLWLKPVFTNGAFSNVENFSIHAETGTVVLGTTIGTIPTTQKMKIFGGTTGSEIGFEVVDSGNVPTLQVQNNGTIQAKNTGTFGWINSGALLRSETLSSMSMSISGNHPTTGAIRFRAGATTHTAAGDYPVTTVEGVWTTSSGSSRWIGNQMNFTINQTGTATGDVVGWHYKPTISGLVNKNIAFLSESGQIVWDSDISPAQLTANTNDYAPTGGLGAVQIRISTDASRNITGLTGGISGAIRIVTNVGSQDAVLTNEDAASTAANRFLFGANYTLVAEQSIMLWYDGVSARWRKLN